MKERVDRRSGRWSRAISSLALLAVVSLLAPSAAVGFGVPGTSPGQMTCPAGPLVIDIWYRDINAPDFGVLDQGWAIDTDFVNIRVWQTAPHAFCMLVKGAGTFVTVAGPSPENTDRDGIPAGIHGFYQFSVRRALFDNQLVAQPDLPRFGYIGTMDGGWNGDQSTLDNAFYFNPVPHYFGPGSKAPVQASLYIYISFGHGIWIQDKATGDHGDITG